MNNNGLQPIPNKNHEDFFKNIDSSNFLYDDFISTDFYELFIQWINNFNEIVTHNGIEL